MNYNVYMFGKNLRKARERILIKQDNGILVSYPMNAAAVDLGKKNLTLYRWETDKFEPSIKEICKLCMLYGIKPNELFEGVEYEPGRIFKAKEIKPRINSVTVLFDGKIKE